MEEQPKENTPKNKDAPKRRKLFIGIILLAILVVVGLLVYRQTSNDRLSTDVNTEAFIEITANGFVPETVVVNPGTIVTWVNKDNESHAIRSNPHDEHDQQADLGNDEPIGPEGSYTYTVPELDGENEQRIDYHDEFNPIVNGTIIVRLDQESE